LKRAGAPSVLFPLPLYHLTIRVMAGSLETSLCHEASMHKGFWSRELGPQYIHGVTILTKDCLFLTLLHPKRKTFFFNFLLPAFLLKAFESSFTS
jgi:hypothetical protein